MLNLGRAEQQVVSVKKLDPITIKPGLKRALNVRMNKKAEQVLRKPAVYMQPHKNAVLEEMKERNKFKPKVMLGDIRKPSCQFSSDLVQIMHNTRIIKKKMTAMGTRASDSLKHPRMQTIKRRKYKKLVDE